jgi:hypothetical protein
MTTAHDILFLNVMTFSFSEPSQFIRIAAPMDHETRLHPAQSGSFRFVCPMVAPITD